MLICCSSPSKNFLDELLLFFSSNNYNIARLEACHNVPGSQLVLLFTYSLYRNNIGVAGAQALAEGLPHCTNPQNLK